MDAAPTSGGSSGAMATLVILILVLALAGVVVYLYISFRDTKVEMEKEIQIADTKAANANKLVADESVNRLGNIKYVVNQVNDINDTIWSTHQDAVSSNQVKIDQLKAANETLIHGVDTFFKFSTDTIANQRLYDSSKLLTANARPRLDVIREVSLLGGVTAKDLAPPSTTATGTKVEGVMAKFCAKGGAPCISFPDKDGETYLTALQEGKNIVMDAPVKIKKGLTFDGAADVSASNGINFNSHVGIGTSASSAVVLNVSPTAENQTILKAGTLEVDSNGQIFLKNRFTGKGDVMMTVDYDGSLTINSPKEVKINGGLNLMGDLKQYGNKVKLETTPDLSPMANSSTSTSTTVASPPVVSNPI